MPNIDTPEAQARYVAMGGNCCPDPSCDGAAETSGQMGSDVNIAFQNCACQKCGLEWTDEYKLSGFSIDS